MTTDQRLGAVYAALRSLGFPVLVMGGHAVRHYGIDRNTIDYDLHVIVDDSAWNRFTGGAKAATTSAWCERSGT